MYKFIKNNISSDGLTESGQQTKIFYKVLLNKQQASGEILEEATPWFKCTDYFNDVVFRQYGKSMIVYGFNNDKLLIPTGDMFVLVKNQGSHFESNLEYINAWLAKRGHPPVTIATDVADVPSGQLVLVVPRWYLNNTIYMSTLWMVVRRGTYPEQLTDNNFYIKDKLSSFDKTAKAFAGEYGKDHQYTISNRDLATKRTEQLEKLLDVKYKQQIDDIVCWSGSGFDYMEKNYPKSTTGFHNSGIMCGLNFANKLKEPA